MAIPYQIIDAFAAGAFTGNPAAVVILKESAEEAWRQSLAAELNLSETAYLQARDDGDWDLRWFTPTVEVDLCGHATLASAHSLWGQGLADPGSPLRFHTRSGLLQARLQGDWIELDFPSDDPRPCDPPAGLLESLGIQAPIEVHKGRSDYLIVVATEAEVRALDPDFSGLGNLECRGVIVTAPGDNEHDLVSRFFAPVTGVDEDPVTGSAHCTLGPYWAKRLGKQELVAYQASARGGLVKIRVAGERTYLQGKAVLIAQGSIEV